MESNPRSELIEVIRENPLQSSSEIFSRLKAGIAYATAKRLLRQLLTENVIVSSGRGKATKYEIGPAYSLLHPIDVERYFEKEQDERTIKDGFQLTLISDILGRAQLFTADEQASLQLLHERFRKNIADLTSNAYNKEMERLAIDLSWKSSQIEGNTYTLLETERLLTEKETAEGKPKDDAVMLLNHKEALNFVLAHPDYVVPLTVRSIEDIHSLLVKDLGVDRNIRQRRVGISGTNYRPPDNEFQIKEALSGMCGLVNEKADVFEKALLTLVLLSYIQAFVDGNKRTARIVSNAVLIANGYCPISFRTVDSIDYKKAMLIFYEQNNIQPFKRIFLDQYEFAVNSYF